MASKTSPINRIKSLGTFIHPIPPYLHSDVHQLHVLEQTALVFVPLSGQLASERKLAAAQLQRHLEAVAVHVVEILHATAQLVPVRTVGDAARERFVTVSALPHHRMIFGVREGCIAEELIVRRAALFAAVMMMARSRNKW